MSDKPLYLLLLDDEASLREPLADYLQRNYGYDITTAANGEEALRLLEAAQGRYDVALIDEVLQEGLTGLEVLALIKSNYPDIEVIVFTGWGMESGLDALRAGAYRYFAKPFKREELALTIRFAAEQGQAQRERRILSALSRVSAAVNSTLDLNEILRRTCQATVELFGVEHSGLALFDEDCTQGTVVAEYPERVSSEGPGLVETVFPIRDVPFEEELISSKEVVSIHDLTTATSLGPVLESLISFGIRSMLIVPVVSKDKVIGSFGLDVIHQPRTFYPNEIELCKSLANQVAVAIENARLFQETKRRAENLETLQSLSTIVSSSLDLAQVLERTCQAAVEFFRADHSGLVLFDADLSQGTVVAEYPTNVNTLGTTIPVHGVAGEERLVYKREPLIVYDVASEADLGPIQDVLRRFDIHSILFAPVASKGKMLGSFSLDAIGVRRRFTHQDTELCRIFAAQVAVAIENAQWFERLRALSVAGQALTSTLNQDEVLKKIVNSALTAFPGAQRGSIHLYDARDDILRLSVYTRPIDAETMATLSFKPGEGIAGWVYNHQVPLVLSDATIDPRYKRIERPGKPIARSMICIPLRIKERTIGVLSLTNADVPGMFRDSDLELLSTFADQAAIAIDNAQLFAKEQESSRRVERQAERLKILYDIGREMTSAQEPDYILDSVAKHIVRLIGARRSLFLLVDIKEKRLLKATGHGYPPQHLQSMTFDEVKAGVSGWVLSTGEPVLVTDAQHDPRNTGTALEKAKRFDTSQLIVAPLRAKGEIIGTLTAVNTVDDPLFTEDDRDLVIMLANQTAVVYDSARVMGELRHLHAAAEAMTSAADIPEVLQRVVNSAQEVLEADYSLIWSYDQSRDVFIPEELVARNVPVEWLEKFRQEEPKTGRTTRRVLEDGYVRVTDLSKTDFIGEPTRTFLEALEVKSFQGIRLDVGSEPVGVLYVDYKITRDFRAEARRLLEHFANDAALTLKRARLIEQVRRSREAARVVARVSTLGRLDDTLETIVIGARDALRCDIATLYTFDENTQRFVQAKGIGYSDPNNMRPPEEIAPDSVLWKIVKQDAPYYYPSEGLSNADLLMGHFVHAESIKSALGIQLRFGKRRVGVMFINYRSSHRFIKEDIENAVQFGDQAAVAIRNEQLYGQVKGHARLVNAAAQVARGATSTLDLDELLYQAVRLICDVFGFYHAGVFLLDDVREHAILQASYPTEGHGMLKRGHSLKVGQEGIVGHVTQMGKPHLVTDVRDDPYYLPNPELPQTRSEMVFPLIARSQVIGALDLQSTEPANLSDEDAATLQTMADQIAHAIHNAQLYRQITERLEESNALQEVAVSLAGASEMIDVLNLVVKEAMKLTNTHESNVLFWDAQKEEFTNALMTDSTGQLQPYSSRARTEGGFTRLIIDQQKATIIADLQQEPRANPEFVAKGYRSVMGVPLLSEGVSIGVLYVRSTEPRHFSDRQIALMETMASQAAVAIERARQYDELKRTKGLVGARTTLAWMGMATNHWRHIIEGQAIDIRNIVTVLRRELSRVDTSERSKRSVSAKLQRIENLAIKIMERPITPPLSSEEGVSRIDVNELIQERLQQLSQNEPYKSSRLSFNSDLKSVSVHLSSEWMRRALDILIDNAIDELQNVERSRRLISVTTRLADNGLEIAVADTGRGMPDEIKRQLFIKRVEKQHDGKGLGMGLLIAQAIAETYGGRLYCAGTGSAGTIMVIWLPLSDQ